jgi:peptidoglycan/xylan/chitin deacetylase (PgdA/CDA1 family)
MRESALWLYQQLTRRSRRQLLDSLRERGEMPVAILFYHRIADKHPNAWTMSRRNFAEQLDWLQQHYDIVSLAEAQRRIRAPFCDRPTVAITFDDGYSENAEYAIAELARRNLTATYFVSTEFVRTGLPFPHDLKAGVPLAPNTVDELRSFIDLGMEIGAHTRNHPDMGKIGQIELIRDEIGGSMEDLRRWLKIEARYFAFPFGLPQNVTQAAVDVIQELGMAGFCTAYGALNWPKSDGFHMRRIHADPGLERLKNWLTLDRRKLHDTTELPFSESTRELPVASECCV